MEKNKFERRLKKTTDHVFSYGLKKLCRKNEKFEDTLNRIGHQVMQQKDFEGFKYAQKIILKSILSIQGEIIAIRSKKKVIKKGKHKKELWQNRDYIEISKKEQHLKIQEAAFREVANSILWLFSSAKRGYLRRLIKLDSANAYLCNRNWKSEMEVVKEINTDKDKFALLSDITSIVSIGDIIVYTRGKIEIIEVKEGKISQKIIEFNYGGEILPGNTTHNKCFYKQAERFKKQLERMEQFRNIYTEDCGIDPFTKQEINIIESSVDEKHINSDLGKLISNPPKDIFKDPIPLLLSIDCYTVGITGLSNASKNVRRMNFQHAIYHQDHVPWEKCDYLVHFKVRGTRDLNDLEPQVYLCMPVEVLRDTIFHPAQMPLFLLIGVDAALKLIFGEISVFIKFYPEKFIETCKKLDVETEWINENDLESFFRSKFIKENLAKFSKGYLKLKHSDDSYDILSKSMFYSMIYELETGESVILKLNHLHQKLIKIVIDRV